MYKSNQMMPTIKDSIPNLKVSQIKNLSQSALKGINPPLSTMKRNYNDPFIPRQFATLNPYRDGIPRKPQYKPNPLVHKSSQPNFMKNSPGQAYFPADEIPKVTGLMP